VGQSIAAVVLVDCVQRLCVAKKQASIDLIFCYFFIKKKVSRRQILANK